MTYDEIRLAWNAQAEDGNGWYSLSEYEKVEWAARFGAAKERAARQAAQTEVADLKERIARAGVDHRRALYEALQQEREACAQVVERNAAACDNHAMLRDVLMSNAAAIRARTT